MAENSFAWVGRIAATKPMQDGKKIGVETEGAGPCSGKRNLQAWRIDRQGNETEHGRAIQAAAWSTEPLRFSGYRRDYEVNGEARWAWEVNAVEAWDGVAGAHDPGEPSSPAEPTPQSSAPAAPLEAEKARLQELHLGPLEEAWRALAILGPRMPSAPEDVEDKRAWQELWLYNASVRMVRLARAIAKAQGEG